jgi:predicted SAM-dependent methyltransferase
MDILAHAFVSPQASSENKFRVMRMMFGGQIDEYDFHYFGWNFEFLRDYLNKTGFSELKKVDSFGLFEDTSDYKLYGFPVSLNLIATK